MSLLLWLLKVENSEIFVRLEGDGGKEGRWWARGFIYCGRDWGHVIWAFVRANAWDGHVARRHAFRSGHYGFDR